MPRTYGFIDSSRIRLRGVAVLLGGLLLAGASLAQKRNANWVCATSWMSFQNGGPVNIPLNEVNTVGKISLSDTTGDLRVFGGYDTQYKLFDAEWQVLSGCPTYIGAFTFEGQGGLFLPIPGAVDGGFYIGAGQAGLDGIDAFGSLRLALGGNDVPPAVMDSDFHWFMDSVCCKRMAVPHANGADYWFVTQKRGTDAIHAFVIDQQGAAGPAVITHTADSLEMDVYHGLMVPTLQGTRFINISHDAVAPNSVNLKSHVDLMEFDASTGLAEPFLTITDLFHVKGAEFSPNGRFLYLADGFWADEQMVRRVYQYDLEQPDIMGARVLLDSTLGPMGSNNAFHALERAPDGKVYVAHEWSPYIGVINQPDLPAPQCGYVHEGFLPAHPVRQLPSFPKRYQDDAPDYPMGATSLRGHDGLRLVPNPMDQRSTLYGMPDGVVWLQWWDMLGCVVSEARGIVQGGRLAVDGGGLRTGKYVLRLVPVTGAPGTVQVMVLH